MGIRLGFLGGASAIGASCVFVDLDGFRVVVDAGIRQARGETLPDLRALQESLGQETPDAFVLTHAHLDHSGALPLLVRAWPSVTLVATSATADLVRILLLDSLKIMELDREEEVPLFSADEVEQTLARIRTVDFDDPVDVAGGRIRLLPAGHILGAGAAVLEHGKGRVVVTGDLSVADQRTVPGMPPPRVRPDVLVVEATYGDRLHASRDAEERRLAEQIAAAVEDGGHVLIPAFAVGRAQEVLLILQSAMRAKRIPRFPVYADGMVRAVCDAYRHHPRFLTPRLRKLVLRGDDLFFSEKSGFQRVASREQRQKVIEGPPCCVVASSGMLAGGASTVYARAWAGRPENLIAITGYQDEEAPGRALLDLARGEKRELRIAGQVVDVQAQVATYHLSAHADGDELVGLVRRMRPRSVYVVHGDRGSRRALADRLVSEGVADVVLPEDGDVFEHRHRPLRRSGGQGIRGLGGGRPLTAEGLGEIRDLLLRVRPDGKRLLTAEDVAASWFGGEVGADEVAEARELLEGPQDAFGPDRRRPYRYRPVPEGAARTGPASATDVLALLDRHVPAESAGRYRSSVHQGERRIVLRYAFPDVAARLAAAGIARVEERTGWSVTIHPHPNQEELVARAREAVGTDVPTGSVSILFDEKTVRLEVEREVPGAGERGAAFLADTGWRLALAVEESVGEKHAAHAAQGAGTPLLPEEVKARLARLFEDVEDDLAPLKATFPAGEVVVHFTHPGMAAQHAERLAALARTTHRLVRVHPHPNHQRLTELVRGRLPGTWEVIEPPAWVPQEDAVRVVVWTLPPEAERTEVLREIEETLGCRVVLVRGD